METGSDPGLEYLESQRTWEHRAAPDRARVARFFIDTAAHPSRYQKSKRYKLADKIPLTPRFERLETSLLKTLATRRTGRERGSRHADFEEVSTLFMAAFGEQHYLPGSDVGANRRKFRTTPGPGGLFSSEIYYLALNTEGLSRGLYHFQPEDAVLEALPWPISDEMIDRLIDLGPEQKTRETSGVVLLTSIPARMRVKYGHRYLRFCMIEAGCVCNSLDLVANALKLNLWHQGEVDELQCRRILHINGIDETILYAAILMGSNRA
jgi:SagB-type dehydrogenase family enzyme